LGPTRQHLHAGDAEVLVRARGVGKKFCRDLKRSLWYGLRDIAAELLPGTSQADPGAARPLRHDEFWAVDDVSFELRRGECLGLIGRNGAGKTTLLKLLNGLLRPDRGVIEIRGRVGGLIALGAGFNPILTGRENVYVNAAVLGLSRREIDAKFDEIVDFAELSEFIDMPVQSYSSGMQVRLGFAVASALVPDVLILDEVLGVGDAAFRIKSFNRIQELLPRAAVIFVSHNMSEVTRICNRVLLLDRGKVLVDEGDLGRAVVAYRATMDMPRTQSIVGSGRWVINAIRVLDADGKQAATLRHGSPFSVSVNVAIHDAVPILSPRLMLIFVDDEGDHVAEVLEPVELPAGEREIAIGMSFREAPFNAGRFRISAALLSGPTGELNSVTFNAATFGVERDTCGYASMIMRPEAIRVA
jgi:lipopolysaccharide transport system ATP-binding protein